MRNVFNVFVPNYPDYNKESPDSYRYRIELYDKDDDMSSPVVYENNLAAIKQIALALRTLVRRDLLIGRNDEPYDSVLVIDNKTDNIIEKL